MRPLKIEIFTNWPKTFTSRFLNTQFLNNFTHKCRKIQSDCLKMHHSTVSLRKFIGEGPVISPDPSLPTRQLSCYAKLPLRVFALRATLGRRVPLGVTANKCVVRNFLKLGLALWISSQILGLRPTSSNVAKKR